jgi:hypothetical protein
MFGDSPGPKPWKGKDIYNSNAEKQTATYSLQGDYSVGKPYWFVFEITIENDGARDSFFVSGVGGDVRYFDGDKDITAEVTDGTYETASLAPGETSLVTVRLLDAGTNSALVTLTSSSNSRAVDTVKAQTKVSGCGC